jgi:hypothetical protein
VGFKIDQNHLARAEAAGVNDALRVHIDQTGFRASDDQAIFIDGKAAGAQAVAIENGAHLAAIGKGERGGAIPRLDAIAGVLQEGRFVAVVGGRDQHAQRFGDGAAILREQFDDFVERGRVGAADGEDRMQIERQGVGAGFHAGAIAPDGVDFAVVREGATGLGAIPTGQHVGGIALMKDGERRLEFGVARSG